MYINEGIVMKKFLFILCVTTIAFFLSLFVKTGKISDETVCLIKSDAVPAETVFVELFIEKEALGDNYISYNKKAVKENHLESQAEIINAELEGLVSYTYHFKDSASSSDLRKCQKGYDTNIGEYAYLSFGSDVDKKSLEKCSKMLLVYSDESGEILGKTNAVTFNKLLRKSHLIVEGENISVKYGGIKTQAIIGIYLIVVIIEIIAYLGYYKTQDRLTIKSQ